MASARKRLKAKAVDVKIMTTTHRQLCYEQPILPLHMNPTPKDRAGAIPCPLRNANIGRYPSEEEEVLPRNFPKKVLSFFSDRGSERSGPSKTIFLKIEKTQIRLLSIMIRKPSDGVQGAMPHVKETRHRVKGGNTSEVNREIISQLSADYLRKRNSTIDLKNKQHQIELAQQRGTLIEKKVAHLQASYLLVNLRQKILNLQNHAHRFIGLTDQNQIRALLHELAVNALNEVANLPEAVIDPKWADKLEKEG